LDGSRIGVRRRQLGGAHEPPACVRLDQIAVVLRRAGKRRLRAWSADGGDLRSLAETIDIQVSALSQSQRRCALLAVRAVGTQVELYRSTTASPPARPAIAWSSRVDPDPVSAGESLTYIGLAYR